MASKGLLSGKSGQKGWSTAATVMSIFGLVLVSLAAVTGLVLGAIAVRNTNEGYIGVPSRTTTANGALVPDRLVHYLAGTGVRAITLSEDELVSLINKEVAIYSTTAQLHTITLSGGATWSGGTTTIATWPATVDTGLTFRVISATSIAVTSNVGPVTFS